MTRQRGFTLIELMVALVVSSLLVGMILAIFTRMSLAYRGQQQVAGVQQVLAAARATLELDAKQAGLAMPNGFTIVSDPVGTVRSPIVQTNSATGPDQIAFFYADTSAQAMVTDATAWPLTLTIDHAPVATEFAVNDLVVLANYTNTTPSPYGAPAANLAGYTTCVLQIANVAANTVTFSQSLPWGSLTQSHCAVPTINSTMLYKFVAHAYRIDASTPARAALGPLQLSPTGGLTNSAADNWTDLAYGFTDIQTAMQFWDSDGVDTNDADTDPAREWYSEGTQSALTAAAASFPVAPLQISISLVARTDRDVEGISTSATPNLIVAAIPDNNTIGDHPSVALPSATDDLLKGNRIYRFTTFQVDLRNMGVGR